MSHDKGSSGERQRAEDRGQRAEGRGQKTEGRRQRVGRLEKKGFKESRIRGVKWRKTEDRGQRTEGRGQRA
ncbi:MAG TPA: hypothetical protein PLF87_06450, partial [Syntrophorhabdaceae bacterium]|nr:hypothetical protein [Syntrophorhabdaceae bacterium]